MKSATNKAIFIIILLIFSVSTGFFYFIAKAERAIPETTLPEHKLAEMKYETSAKTWQNTITLGAIGDILIHDRVYMDAKTETGYNFMPMFEEVKPLLQQPDVLLANQETILGGTELGLSGYPTFNSPAEVGNALVDAGVDIVSTANNHALDKGERGILSSISHLEALGLPYVGYFKSAEDQQTVRILEKEGIKLAYLAYTYGTNGIPIPSGKDYLVNIIDREKMKQEIERAKQEADVIIMSLHWGKEYQRIPTKEQEDLAHFLVNEGVDIIFAHHPHVLQKMEQIARPDGNFSLVVYSLGNFLSGQVGDYKDIGGMATVDVTKTVDQNGKNIALSNVKFYPTYVASQHASHYRVIPLQNAQTEATFTEIMDHMTNDLP
ncbi:CapA family protein [Bacillaceae bacterium Marseille-Q3522]|nr:CapA family protein [Bacillaceae bacterium Marseille-Q3522]